MITTVRVKTSIGAASICALLAFPLVASAGTATVALTDNIYTPNTLTVYAGDTVVWQNNGSSVHSVTSDAGLFDSGPIQPGKQFAATFPTSGTYAYHSSFDGGSGGVGMSGTIVVANTSGASTNTSTYVNPNTNFNQTVTTNANTTASADPTTASLTAQIQLLIAQINTLQGRGGASTQSTGATSGAVGTCPQIGRVLSLGASGSDVTSLQQFLAADPSVYPEASITGYFGALTQAAVQRWQAKNSIISYGTPASTGYGVVGPRTASAIRLACSNGSTTSTTQSSSVSSAASTAATNSTVSGFIQVSPVTGTAPLSVNVTATVNTTASCAPSTYAIDFGDGSGAQQIIIQQNQCAQAAQTFTHIYPNAGTYTVTLFSGSHQTTATVVVSGSTTTTATTTTTAPSGTLTAFVTIGPAPLSTTFYVSCSSGVAYDVVFGDGTDLGGSGVSQSQCSSGLQSIPHTYTSAGTYNAQLVVFSQVSAGSPLVSQVVAQKSVVVGAPITTGGSSTSYPAMVVTTSYGGNAFAFGITFGGACQNYQLNWGDSGNPSSGVCTGSDMSLSHTYATTGNYTITLTRDTQVDTTAVAITQ